MFEQIAHEWAGGMKDLDPSRGNYERVLEQWGHLLKTMKVTTLKFAHNEISECFLHWPHQGEDNKKLFEDLRCKKQKPMDLNPLVVVHWRQNFLCICGNRRLRALYKYQDMCNGPVLVRCLVHRFPNVPRSLMGKFLLSINTCDAAIPGVRRRRNRR